MAFCAAVMVSCDDKLPDSGENGATTEESSGNDGTTNPDEGNGSEGDDEGAAAGEGGYYDLPLDDYHPTGSMNLNGNERKVVSDNVNMFAWQFVSKVAGIDRGDGIIVSPFSATMALSMLMTGSTGFSYDEIVGALGWRHCNIYDISSTNRRLVYDLPLFDGSSSLAIANSIWTKPTLDIRDMYSKQIKAYYDAEQRTIYDSFVSDVNEWCNEKTHGLIPQFLTADDDKPDMILLNAIYMKAGWPAGNEFDAANNRIAKFHNDNGTESDVEFMYCDNHLMPYLEAEDGTRVAFKPLGERYEFVIMLPNAGTSIDSYLAKLADGEWGAIVDKVSHRSEYKVEMTMPKFKLTGRYGLKNVFEGLGLRTVFIPRNAHFEYLTTNPDLYVSEIRQVTTLDVCEKGIEASAVTAILMPTASGEAADPYPSVEMKVDRPFAYAIIEPRTGLILFAGAVRNL